jgi:zinc transport system substrate-binding protein
MGSAFALAVAALAETPLRVVVSILPQQQFVERIGGEHVDVHTLVQPGYSPATYEPSPRQMAELSRADMYFRIGVPFEAGLLPKIKDLAPALPVIDTRRNIAMLEIDATAPAHPDADHGHRHERGKDPHIWMDPCRVMQQAVTIYEALAAHDPEHEKVYRKNLQAFITELIDLHADLLAVLAPVRGEVLMVFHPAFGYFAHAYGLEQQPIETGGKSPGARQLAKIIQRAEQEQVRVLFVQPQFDRKSATTVAGEIDGAVVAINPLAGDYMANMREIADKVKQGLIREEPEPGTP